MTEVARVTIVKAFDEDADGSEVITTEFSDGLSLLDALGMLAFVQATALADWSQG